MNSKAWLSLFITTLFCGADMFPKVKISPGWLQGDVKETRSGKKFRSFQAIPFAKPPVGELRFKEPVSIERWEGIRDATKAHNLCPQVTIFATNRKIFGDEDCLYLNVYTPLVENSTDAYPVMVYLHGGGFTSGGAIYGFYSPEFLLDQDIILVVPNYRLGAFGFLSTGDEVVPGNNGLKDQNLALRWVKENIGFFGGDPSRITIFGESAGGASVHFHMVSPLSIGLFQGAIAQSGTAQCLWSVAPKAQSVRNTRTFAKEFGCASKNSTEIVDCLRKVPALDLVKKYHVLMKWDYDPVVSFKPVIESPSEEAFIVEHPAETMKKGNFAKVPFITGLTTSEGALRATRILANEKYLREFSQRFDELVPLSLQYDVTSTQVESITKKIKDFYFGSDGKIDVSSKNAILDVYSDGMFVSCADDVTRLYLKKSPQPLYFYLFDHRGASSFSELFGDANNDYGVCHADDLQYLFPFEHFFNGRHLTEVDKRVSTIMTTLWTNFARTGNPTPEINGIIPNKWYPMTDKNEIEYFHIAGNGLKMEKGLYKERVQFWRTLPIWGENAVSKDEL